MTKDDILSMAKKADFCVNDDGEISTSNSYGIIRGELDSFAALVAAAEREACAKVCDPYTHGQWFATVIRERSANAGARGLND